MDEHAHNHDHCNCNETVNLTKIRKCVYDTIVNENGPIKAYDIIERLRDADLKLTPATIYRSLDYHIEKGLIHKINALNAFVSCTCDNHNHEHKTSLMLICSKCHRAQEILDSELCDSIHEHIFKHGMVLEHNCIEIQGICSDCQSAEPHADD